MMTSAVAHRHYLHMLQSFKRTTSCVCLPSQLHNKKKDDDEQHDYSLLLVAFASKLEKMTSLCSLSSFTVAKKEEKRMMISSAVVHRHFFALI
jgi:hypothetical protein